MRYNIYNKMDLVSKEERAKLVEASFEGKTIPIPIPPLALFVKDGLRNLLLKLECLGKPKAVKVEFVEHYDGEVNFETDDCKYITTSGKVYYAYLKGNLRVTEEEITLVCETLWYRGF